LLIKGYQQLAPGHFLNEKTSLLHLHVNLGQTSIIQLATAMISLMWRRPFLLTKASPGCFVGLSLAFVFLGLIRFFQSINWISS
jgi:hypothetical protein